MDFRESDYSKESGIIKTGGLELKGSKTFRNKTKLDFSLNSDINKTNSNDIFTSKSVLDNEELSNTHLTTTSENKNLNLSYSMSYQKYFKKIKSTTAYALKLSHKNGNINSVQIDTMASSSNYIYLERTADHNNNSIYGSFNFRKYLFNLLNFETTISFYGSDDRKERIAFDVITNKQDTANSYNYNLKKRDIDIKTYWGLQIAKKTTIGFNMEGTLQNHEYTDLIPYTYNYSISKFSPQYTLSLKTHFNMLVYSELSLVKSYQIPSVTSYQDRITEITPYSLSAGNPNLQKSSTFAIKGTINVATYNLGTLSTDFSLSFGDNTVTTIKRIFTKDTYLPEYGYMARKGAILSTFTNAGNSRSINLKANYSKTFTTMQGRLNINYNWRLSKNPIIKNGEVMYRNSSVQNYAFGYSCVLAKNLRPSINYSLTTTSNKGSGIDVNTSTNRVSIGNNFRFFKRMRLNVSGSYTNTKNSFNSDLDDDSFNMSASTEFNLFKKQLLVNVYLRNIIDNDNNYETKTNSVYTEVSRRINLGRMIEFSLTWRFKNDSSNF
jgi:hypothetical protein